MGTRSKKQVKPSRRRPGGSKGKHNPHLEDYEKYMPVEEKPKNSLYHDWGHQAIINYLIGKAAVTRLYPLVPDTLVPLLIQHSGNQEDVEAAFEKIKGLNEKPERFDSFHEKYRKMYGNYVREIEWCCSELRKYLPKKEYEELIIDSTVHHIRGVLGEHIDKMKEMMVSGAAKENFNREPTKKEEIIKKIMKKAVNFNFKHIFNPAGWLVGDVEIEDFNPLTTEMLMNVKDCLMLRAPRMRQLPEQACLLA